MQVQTVAFFSGNIGSGEFVLLFALILVLFGPRRLPSLAREIGVFLAKLQRTAQDFRDQIMNLDSHHKVPPISPPASSSSEEESKSSPENHQRAG